MDLAAAGASCTQDPDRMEQEGAIYRGPEVAMLAQGHLCTHHLQTVWREPPHLPHLLCNLLPPRERPRFPSRWHGVGTILILHNVPGWSFPLWLPGLCCPAGSTCKSTGTYSGLCVPKPPPTAAAADPPPGFQTQGAPQVCTPGPLEPPSATMPSAIIIGDSVSIGYTPHLQTMYGIGAHRPVQLPEPHAIPPPDAFIPPPPSPWRKTTHMIAARPP